MTKLKEKAVVLLSSGLDSTINLYRALEEYSEVLALTIDYGQRAAHREIERASAMCDNLKLKHQVIAMPWFGKLAPGSSLTGTAKNIPTGEQVDIDSLTTSEETAKSVWVPNRNGVLLNIAAAYAEASNAKCVIPGFNREEAATFPDNTIEFSQAVTTSLSFSTANQVEIRCFTAELDKTQIVELGKELNAPFDLIWPCYLGGVEPCRECESCKRFYRAMGEV